MNATKLNFGLTGPQQRGPIIFQRPTVLNLPGNPRNILAGKKHRYDGTKIIRLEEKPWRGKSERRQVIRQRRLDRVA